MNLLLGCWLNSNSFAGDIDSYNPVVPNEVKFANVTFQLNDVTKYLILNEMKDIQSNRQVLLNKLEKATLFFPIVEPILREQGVPDDFKFLVNYDKYQSSVEKNGIPEAGVFWCLDRQKAEEVDLLMNEQVDERKHLIAATRGAALCLRRNNVLYSNWGATLYSLIAHKRIINQLEVNRKWANVSDNENQYIALDSPAYISLVQFLAYKLVIEQEFPAFKPQVSKIVYEYPYSKGKSLNRISAELKVDLAILNEYNPWLLAKNVPDTDCQVLVIIPSSRFSEIRVLTELSKKSGLPTKDLGFPLLKKETKSKGKGGVFYQINNLEGLQAEMCDNPVTMAYKADIPLKRFVEYNDIKENDLLQIGQVYYLEDKSAKASVPFHVVREGETLWSISQTYGVKLENLLKYNRFETVQRLQRGRIIWLQTTRPKNKPVEYINMPDELEAIDAMVRAESNQEMNEEVLNKEPMKIDTVVLVEKGKVEVKENIGIKGNTNEVSLAIKEKELNSSPLTQEIRKEETMNLNLPKTVDKTNITPPVQTRNETESKATPPIAPQSTNTLKDKTTEQQDNFLYHKVRKDDTLFRISVNYNVTLDDLWKLNKLSSNIVKVGVVLKIRSL
ncbi:LysM peptidoglycan-binding domain-containing protein [Emticicia sp. C21]|uniref:LysM peptidoglycan-binding domain-containing protein n=1 Tax=Emticicia sp. C21 TaxID=2302915 RepID=UPI00131470A1|nr:LysM peptidoglycan-binding domain-containing protein [Emticicia sp. C21]